MRRLVIATLLLSAPLVACASGGGAGESANACGSITATGGCTPAPTAPATAALLLKPASTTTYAAAGGSHQVTQQVQNSVRLEGFTSEVADAASDKLAVTYNPATDAFTVKITTRGAGANIIFDDPLYRTAFGGARQPQPGVPQIAGYEYLQRGAQPGSANEIQTFFYQTPGATTRYVTLAGFVRTARPAAAAPTDPPATSALYAHAQAAEVFGVLTPRGAGPTTGRATYRGDMLASAIYNTELDAQPNIRSRLEWISGQANLTLDFANSTVSAEFSGAFLPTADPLASLGQASASNAGKSFLATGSAKLAAEKTSFSGALSSVSVGGVSLPLGASTLNGALYGPTGQEVGGGFRLVGAGADQRVEIIGAFTGAR